MAKCINKNIPEFENLLSITGYNPVILSAKVSVWQEKNNTDRIPNIRELFSDNEGKKYQKVSDKIGLLSNEDAKSVELTVKEIAYEVAGRIGTQVKFDFDSSSNIKGYHTSTHSYINLAHATLDTPVHEIIAHPVIKHLKELDREKKNFLYSNLLKELEHGYGKEILDKVRETYKNEKVEYILSKFKNFKYKDAIINGHLSKIPEKHISLFHDNKEYIITELANIYSGDTGKELKHSDVPSEVIESFQHEYNIFTKDTSIKEDFTEEDFQEEAIVQLLGEYTTKKIIETKNNKNLFSLLRQLLSQMTDYLKSLFQSKELYIEDLSSEMTLEDLSTLLGYRDSKIILPGHHVEYITPDRKAFYTLQEARDNLRKATITEEEIKDIVEKSESFSLPKEILTKDVPHNFTFQDEVIYFRKGTWYKKRKGFYGLFSKPEEINSYMAKSLYKEYLEDKNKTEILSESQKKFYDFYVKNRQYEASANIIEEWKEKEGIVYNPEEIWSRGEGFYSALGAYSRLDTFLILQNLLKNIKNNELLGSEFTISAFTKEPGTYNSIDKGGSSIRFNIVPESHHIKWASKTDVYSGSVRDTSTYFNENVRSEILGVSETKAPSISNITEISTNLSEIVDNRGLGGYDHNELGIVLTSNNFRLEYDENIPYKYKKLINNINNYLDGKYGVIKKPTISKNNPVQPKITAKDVAPISDYAENNSIQANKKALYDKELYTYNLAQKGLFADTYDNDSELGSKGTFRISSHKGKAAIKNPTENTLGLLKEEISKVVTVKKKNKTNLTGEDYTITKYAILNNQLQDKLLKEIKKPQPLKIKDEVDTVNLNIKLSELNQKLNETPKSFISSRIIKDKSSATRVEARTFFQRANQEEFNSEINLVNPLFQNGEDKKNQTQSENTTQKLTSEQENIVQEKPKVRQKARDIVKAFESKRQEILKNLKDSVIEDDGSLENTVLLKVQKKFYNNSTPKQKEINIYSGTNENAHLSNFAIRPFEYTLETPSGEKTYTFQSVEQAFQFHKAVIIADAKLGARMLKTSKGAELKKLGSPRNLPMTREQREKWDSISKNIMTDLMYESFAQNPIEAKKLLDTGEAKLTHKYKGIEQDEGRFSEVINTVRNMLIKDGFDETNTKEQSISENLQKTLKTIEEIKKNKDFIILQDTESIFSYDTNSELLDDFNFEETIHNVFDNLNTYEDVKNELSKLGINFKNESLAKEYIEHRIKTGDTSWYRNAKTGKIYRRVTDVISENKVAIRNNDLVKSAQIIGTKIDVFVRDFFAGKLKNFDSYELASEYVMEGFLEQLKQLKETFDNRGETVISEDIVLFNDEYNVAGTVDLLTYDKDGVIRIYDMKTMRGNQLKDVHKSGVNKGKIKYFYSYHEKGDSNAVKHTKQMSVYGLTSNKTHGTDIKDIFVLAFETNYDAGDVETKKINFLGFIPLDMMKKIPGLEVLSESASVDARKNAKTSKFVNVSSLPKIYEIPVDEKKVLPSPFSAVDFKSIFEQQGNLSASAEDLSGLEFNSAIGFTC